MAEQKDEAACGQVVLWDGADLGSYAIAAFIELAGVCKRNLGQETWDDVILKLEHWPEYSNELKAEVAKWITEKVNSAIEKDYERTEENVPDGGSTPQ